MLEPMLWSYAEFVRDKAHRWVSAKEEGEYAEVDRRREMNGKIDHSQIQFGERCREQFFNFEEGYINLNHGRLIFFYFLLAKRKNRKLWNMSKARNEGFQTMARQG